MLAKESSTLSIKISVYVLFQAAVGQGMAHIEALKSDSHRGKPQEEKTIQLNEMNEQQ